MEALANGDMHTVTVKLTELSRVWCVWRAKDAAIDKRDALQKEKLVFRPGRTGKNTTLFWFIKKYLSLLSSISGKKT